MDYNCDSKLDRDSERDNWNWVNLRRDDEDDSVGERKSRYDEADSDDYRNGDRDYGKIRVQNYSSGSEPESNRARRSKRGRARAIITAILHLLLARIRFIAHLVNHQVIHVLIVRELLTLLLGKPTDFYVKAAVCFVMECGSFLQDLSPQGLHDVFERFRGFFHEGEIDERVKLLIKDLFVLRKADFQGYPTVRPELDVVDQEFQWTHEVSLMGEIDRDIALDIFRPDPNFLKNEKRYEEVKKQILGEEETDTNLVHLRKTICSAITFSSVDYEEAELKLLRIKLKPGQEVCCVI